MASQEITLNEFTSLLKRASIPVSFSHPLKVIQQILIRETHKNFAKESSPDGVPWAPLKRPRPAKKWVKKAGIKTKDKILRDTDLLMISVTSQFAAGNVCEITDKSVTWGSNIEYAGVHNFGFAGPDKLGRMLNIPQREFLGITEEMHKQCEDIVTNSVIDQILKEFPK